MYNIYSTARTVSTFLMRRNQGELSWSVNINVAFQLWHRKG